MAAPPTGLPPYDDSITALLRRLADGDRAAEQLLIPQISDELHRIAKRHMKRERMNHTLQPTALVNEAYIRLVECPDPNWKCRGHFYAAAAKVMRHILVDHARAHQAAKRAGAAQRVKLDDRLARTEPMTIEILELNEALDRLAEFDPRQVRVVELHFFGGLDFAEIGEILEISSRSAKRDWSMARSWLITQLHAE
jgi:RNA polymerase sigma-70 factor (ECF subfamily)